MPEGIETKFVDVIELSVQHTYVCFLVTIIANELAEGYYKLNVNTD